MVAVERINQFSTWSTQELKEWVEVASLLPDILTTYNLETCLQAVEELNIREGVYEDEVLHRC